MTLVMSAVVEEASHASMTWLGTRLCMTVHAITCADYGQTEKQKHLNIESEGACNRSTDQLY